MNILKDAFTAGVTNDGNISVCVGGPEQCYQVALTIEAAELAAKVLLLSIDAAKGMRPEKDATPLWTSSTVTGEPT